MIGKNVRARQRGAPGLTLRTTRSVPAVHAGAENTFMGAIRMIVLLIAVHIIVLPAQAQAHSDQVEAAVEAAQAWVVQIDAGEIGAGWRSAAPIVRETVTEDRWVAAIQQVRDQVGTLQERTLAESEHRTSLPNAPDGEYVVLRYASSFERAPQVLEVLIMVMMADGDWKAAGYQVVPALQQHLR